MPMIDKPARIVSPPYLKTTFWHSVLIVLVVVAVLFWQKDIAIGIMLGAAVFIVPNTYFAWQAFRHTGAARAREAKAAFYKGQAGKFVLTLVMFAMVFSLFRLEYPWAVLVSYGVNVLIHLLLAVVMFRQSKIYS